MPYVAPSTVVAGQTYSAASHNIIVNDIIDHEDRLDTVQNAQYPARNVLVNGAMQFAQRATSVSGISSGLSVYYTADRWNTYVTNAGTYTHAISADAPAGSGFRNSYRVTCATAITSLSSNAIQIFRQRLEGQTLQHIKKGTASAQQLTASFWVKGSTTGTYIVALEDNDNTRYVASSYTISAANTWEQKTITFPADTTGVLDNDNAASLDLLFWLVAGSDFTSGTLATTWAAASNPNKAVGQTNLAASVNNYIAFTGVQLEPGSQASPFEFVRYDDELLRCQRYYETGTTWLRRQNNDTVRSSYEAVPYRVRKRATPGTVSNTNTNTTNVSICTFVNVDDTGGYITWTASSSVDFQAQVAWTASAEL